MIDDDERVLLFVRDFTGLGDDQFFWLAGDNLVQVQCADLVSTTARIICHDFWAVRDVIFGITGSLPTEVVDLDELRITVSGNPDDRKQREKIDITSFLSNYGVSVDVCGVYKQMFYRGREFDEVVGVEIAGAMRRMYDDLLGMADQNSERERFFDVEVPVFRVVQLAMANGVRVDKRLLSDLRDQAEFEYFLELKGYSAKHNMPLETPSEADLRDKIYELGFDLTGVSIDYILEYLPHSDGFGDDTIRLREVDMARRILSSVTLSTERVHPIADVFGSRTSRIQLRNPALQNIAKRYRKIIIPDSGFQLSYVDYDQYEVGIMAALSGDAELLRLYQAGDMYELFAREHLGLRGGRKAAKQLFLSYAYGMSRKALIDAAVSLGADREKAKRAFRRFEVYEQWKKSIGDSFVKNGVVATSCGNHFKRRATGQLSAQEARSAVSQVVQGTASLIFKKALLEVQQIQDVRIVLPVHDALLFAHARDDTPMAVVGAFERVMTSHLAERIKGKASIGQFFDVD